MALDINDSMTDIEKDETVYFLPSFVTKKRNKKSRYTTKIQYPIVTQNSLSSGSSSTNANPNNWDVRSNERSTELREIPIGNLARGTAQTNNPGI